MAIVIPRAFSSGALSMESKLAETVTFGCSSQYPGVIAAVSVVLP